MICHFLPGCWGRMNSCSDDLSGPRSVFLVVFRWRSIRTIIIIKRRVTYPYTMANRWSEKFTQKATKRTIHSPNNTYSTGSILSLRQIVGAFNHHPWPNFLIYPRIPCKFPQIYVFVKKGLPTPPHFLQPNLNMKFIMSWTTILNRVQ